MMSAELEKVLLPWRKLTGDRPTVTRAEGVYFWDSSGRRYIDFGSQSLFTNFGLSERRVVEAIQDQANKFPVMAPYFGTEVQTEVARLLREIAPGDLTHVFFSTSGAEANEAAIKMARQITGRPLIVTRYPSYHGATYGALSVSMDSRSWPFEPGVPGVVSAPVCYPYRCQHAPPDSHCTNCGEHCAESLHEVIVANGPSRIAAVILEPIVGPAGVIIPADGYMQRVREICDRYGILLIADEVMTGFCRTGRWFACDQWNVVPDIMTLAKAITGGYVPLGATMVREGLARKTWHDQPFLHGHTLSNHPLACAAAIAAINLYREDHLAERSTELGNFLLGRALDLKARHRSVGEVRGMGLFVGIELVKNRQSKEPLPNDRVQAALWAAGFWHMRSFSNVIVLAPALTITREQIDEGIEYVDAALEVADAEAEH